jgi:hypothetical protein
MGNNIHPNLYQVIQKLYEIKLALEEQLFKYFKKVFYCLQNRLPKIPNIWKLNVVLQF